MIEINVLNLNFFFIKKKTNIGIQILFVFLIIFLLYTNLLSNN